MISLSCTYEMPEWFTDDCISYRLSIRYVSLVMRYAISWYVHFVPSCFSAINLRPYQAQISYRNTRHNTRRCCNTCLIQDVSLHLELTFTATSLDFIILTKWSLSFLRFVLWPFRHTASVSKRTGNNGKGFTVRWFYYNDYYNYYYGIFEIKRKEL